MGGAVAETESGERWPNGLDRWTALATGRCGWGSNPTAENFASELWQFCLPHFGGQSLLSGVYVRGSKISHQSALECITVVDSTTVSEEEEEGLTTSGRI